MRGRLIDAYLRASGAAGAHQRVGPFLARYTPASAHPMLNYAVPDDGARATPEQADALADAFERRGLLVRLEFAGEAAPDLEADLRSAGFVLERRLAVLTCEPRHAPPAPSAAGFTVLVATTSREHAEAISVAGAAHGEPAGLPSEAQVGARRKLAAAGGAVVLARDASSGEPAGSGVLTVPRAGVSELAGVGTGPAFRRRGVAGAVVGRLLEHAASRGVRLVWLTPEDAGAERVYARAGFERTTTEIVHLARPSGAGALPRR